MPRVQVGCALTLTENVVLSVHELSTLSIDHYSYTGRELLDIAVYAPSIRQYNFSLLTV